MKTSLRTKFIIFITIAIVAFDFIFLLTSVNLYNRDKESYIYENVLNSSRSISQLLGKHFDQIRIISNLDFLSQKELTFPPSMGIENIQIYDFKKKAYIYQLKQLNALEAPQDKELQKYLSHAEDEISIVHGPDGIRLFYWRLLNQDQLLQITSNITSFIQTFKQQGIYSILFFDRKNERILNFSPIQDQTIEKISWVDLKKDGKQEGAQDFSFADQEYIMSFSPTADNLIKVVSLIHRSAAFSASKNLIYQNIALAVIFIGVSIIVILFLAKLITNPLGELTRVASDAGEGKYEQHIKNNSTDEIGILVQAFNKMFADIKKYTEELKDKYRIENEIKLAKGVQEQYIPKVDFHNSHIELAGFYLPASECSGDWWNYRAHKDVTYLFISDVTGHGLPSALLTSAVNSCCAAIDNQIKHTGKFVNPSEILKVINDVIYQSSANLMLTMCVARVDHQRNKIVFSNASHEFPLLIEADGNIKTLLANPGNRLGETSNSEYSDAELDFTKNDLLFMYTDGLVENPNSIGKSWGDRALLRFLKKIQHSPEKSRDELKEAYFKFIEHGEVKDDVTFFFAKLL